MRLDDYSPRWEGSVLHLLITGPNAELTPVEVHPDHFACGGLTIAPEAIERFAVMVLRKNKSSTYELRLLPSDDFKIPILRDRDHNELIRVLRAWHSREEVRAAWGTPELDELLLPTLDAEQLEKWDAVQTAEGLQITIDQGANPVMISGCLGGLLLPVVFMGCIILGSSGLTGPTRDYRFLVFFVVYALIVYPGVVVVAALIPRNPSRRSLVLGQHGLVLRSVLIPWASVSDCHARLDAVHPDAHRAASGDSDRC